MKSLINILRFILNHPIGSQRKLTSLKRFFFYQISKIFNPYPIVFKWTERTKLIIEKGMTGATGNLYCGLHEFEDMSFLLHFLREEDLFVDVGANIGSYTILASGHIGCRTMAFEPIPSTYKHLENNVTINQIESLVECRNLGIGAEKSELFFTEHLDTVNHVAYPGEASVTVKIEVDTLDSVLQPFCPVLLKIDVEGYELPVLKGAMNILNNVQLNAIIIELNGSGKMYGFSDEIIHQMLLSFGFLPYRYLPFKRELVRMDSFGSQNTLYLRETEKTLSKLKNSPLIKILQYEY